MPGMLPRMKPIADTEELELPAIFPVSPFITAAAGGEDLQTGPGPLAREVKAGAGTPNSPGYQIREAAPAVLAVLAAAGS
jgi:hypothetical protein